MIFGVYISSSGLNGARGVEPWNHTNHGHMCQRCAIPNMHSTWLRQGPQILTPKWWLDSNQRGRNFIAPYCYGTEYMKYIPWNMHAISLCFIWVYLVDTCLLFIYIRNITLPISSRFTSLAPGQYCPGASEVTLKHMGKIDLCQNTTKWVYFSVYSVNTTPSSIRTLARAACNLHV